METPLILLLAVLGHLCLWSTIVNRVHGVAWPRWLVDGLTITSGLMFLALPMAIAAWRIGGEPQVVPGTAWAVHWYVWACCLFLAIAALERLLWALRFRDGSMLLSNDTSPLPTQGNALVAKGLPGLVGRLPGNEALQPQLHVKHLALSRLPAAQSGLRLLHLSDLHMCGRIGKQYFLDLVGHANELEADFVFLTGDIVEYPAYLDWVDDTLGELRAKSGTYFVVGNHDQRVERPLIELLTSLGWVHLGGRVVEKTVEGGKLLLSGNELPWSGTVAEIPARASDDRGELRILAAHTPDQFYWAAEQDFDLVLAGHTHGGQICLPGLGAIASPSVYGTRFAGGLYRKGSTVMHVTRGAASLTPFRWNCPPEVALLELRPS